VVTFIIRRLIASVFLLIIVAMITFAIFFLLPRLAGQTTYALATQYVGRNPTHAAVLAVEQQLGLNRPLYLQFGSFLKAIVVGRHFTAGPQTVYCPPPCFGYSFKSQLPVWPQMVSDIPVTLSLAIGAAVIWLVSGVSIGVLSALKRGTVFDEDYIRTARAKGLPERTVISKHGLRAALTPVVTIFGMDLGLLLGGAVITEYTFGLHGLGLFTIEAVQSQDLPEILGVTLLAAFFIVIANLFVDVLYAYIDPRVRH